MLSILAGVLLVVALATRRCEASSKILVVSNCPSISHSIWYNKLVDLLELSNHKVVFIDVEPDSRKSPNVTHIHLEGGYGWREELDKSVGGQNPKLLEEMAAVDSPTEIIDELADLQVRDCRTLISSPAIKWLLKEYKGVHFDLIIFDFLCESFFALVPFFGNPPFIVATAYADPSSVLRMVGHYDNPAYVPAQLTRFTPRMGFFERLTNLWYHFYHHWANLRRVIPAQDAMAKEVLGDWGGPSVGEIAKEAALVMVNTHFVATGAKPLPPAVIPVGGLHVDPPKPLPKRIKDFLDGGKDGAVFLSFGSNIPSSGMPKEKVQMLINVFKDLPQRVLWKYEVEDVKGLPSNVMIAKWLPQNDVLGHPNVKCFISHGGLLGTQEAIHHGVPIIGVPFMFDQFEVVRYLENEGVAIQLDYLTLSEGPLRKSLDKVFKERSISQKMATYSQVYHDMPQTAKQRALFWIEYVMRNSKNKNYLRSASRDLSWYQLIMLDIVLFELAVVFLSIYLIRLAIKAVLFREGTKQKKA